MYYSILNPLYNYNHYLMSTETAILLLEDYGPDSVMEGQK
jgi:hypothetical protein